MTPPIVPLSISTHDASKQLNASFTYTYDAAGNTLTETDQLGRSPAVTQSYQYDALSRLTGQSDPRLQTTYAYDAVGNRVSMNQTVGHERPRVTAYAYDAADQLLSINGGGSGERDDSRPRSFTYDGNGNLLQQRTGEDDQNQRFTWDAANRLVAISGHGDQAQMRYQYDGDGHLYVEHQGDDENDEGSNRAIHYTLDQSGSLSQILSASSGRESANFLYGRSGDRLATLSTRNSAYFLTDARGSVRGTTDTHGRLTSARTYDAWGAPARGLGAGGDSEEHADFQSDDSGQNALTQLFGFDGERQDPRTGLVQLRARWYQPATGRMLGRDPLSGYATQPMTGHPYQFAFNNPMRYGDPSGRSAVNLLRALDGMPGFVGGLYTNPRLTFGSMQLAGQMTPGPGILEGPGIGEGPGTIECLLQGVGCPKPPVDWCLDPQMKLPGQNCTPPPITPPPCLSFQTPGVDNCTPTTGWKPPCSLIGYGTKVTPDNCDPTPPPPLDCGSPYDLQNIVPCQQQPPITNLCKPGENANVTGCVDPLGAGGGNISPSNDPTAPKDPPPPDPQPDNPQTEGQQQPPASQPDQSLLDRLKNASEAEAREILREILQKLTDEAAEQIRQDPSLLRQLLSPGQYEAGTEQEWIARANYGHAVEELVSRKVGQDPVLREIVVHFGGSQPGQEVPDFITRTGIGIVEVKFDVTTIKGQQTHGGRSYSQGLLYLTYQRNEALIPFPR